MVRYFIRFSYIGSQYRGAAKVVRGNTVQDTDTIQGALQLAFLSLRPKTQAFPTVYISSRTDAGVHALNSTAHVELQTFYCSDFLLSHINRYMIRCHHNIRLLEAIPVTQNFSARHAVKRRTYLYRLMKAKDPNEYRVPIIEMQHTYNLRRGDFDVEHVKKATQLFVGLKDFTTFSAKKESNKEIIYVRELYGLSIEEAQPLMAFDELSQNFNYWNITCTARSFLYNQVRRIVTALIGVGTGKITDRDIQVMLQVPGHHNWDKRLQLVPAYGLHLLKVEYDQNDIDKCTVKQE